MDKVLQKNDYEIEKGRNQGNKTENHNEIAVMENS